MTPNQNDKNEAQEEPLFKRPGGILLDEKQWAFIKDRYHMTPRELQVAILVCRGFSNDEIARALGIKHGTIKTHLRNIYRRVRVKSKITLLLKLVEDVKRHYVSEDYSGKGIPIEEISMKREPSEEEKESRR